MFLDVYGVHTSMRVKLPQPLSFLIKHWVQDNAHGDLPASLSTLEQAIRSQVTRPSLCP
jgi:hypothetical protein